MELDFDQLRRLKESFHDQFRQDGNVSEQLSEGSMVYSIGFNPDEGTAQVHVQWPYFRDLVANDSDYPATYRKVENEGQQAWLHWECSVLGVQVVSCMERYQIIEEITNVYPAWTDHPNLENLDIEQLLKVFMDATGWNTVSTNVEAPTVDAVEVVHGQWEDVKETAFPYDPNTGFATTHTAETCSVCNVRIGFIGSKAYLYDNYCPNCGAKMDGGNTQCRSIR